MSTENFSSVKDAALGAPEAQPKGAAGAASAVSAADPTVRSDSAQSASLAFASDAGSPANGSAPTDPPSGNTGGKMAGGGKRWSPLRSAQKLLPVSLPQPGGEPLAALTDHLNTTFPFEKSEERLAELRRLFHEFLGEPFAQFTERNGGFHGYRLSYDIGQTKAILGVGGQCGTALVSLCGFSCAQIKDWHRVYQLFKELLYGRITRWDGAVDVLDGNPSVDDAVALYLSDQFNCGGNRPSCDQRGNWIQPDGTGRTFYVGKRKNGKLLRAYEKGKQLGNPESPWVRWELELHNRDRVVPWDVILEPGRYVAGAYPCMAWVNERQERIRTLRKTSQLSYDHLTYYARQAYGPLISVMLAVEGSAEKVVERLLRPGVPTRLDGGLHSPVELLTGDDTV